MTADIAIIGAGSGGLSVAAAAAQLGAKTLLFERHLMGGDCLNTGCVPSKSLLAAARIAAARRTSQPFGILPADPQIDWQAVQAHVRQVIEGIAPHDSADRFRALGAEVIQRQACFVGPREILADGQRYRFKYAVIATGSRPVIPPVPGLEACNPLTNETIFDLTERPDQLLILGGGPIGVEMALAHRRLGVPVQLVEAGQILAREDRQLADILAGRLADEGVEIHQQALVTKAGRTGRTVWLELADGQRLEGTHLLVAAGREAVIDGLGLDKAGVTASPAGIQTDTRLRTSNRRIFAIGDVAGRQQFTHIAAAHASIAIRNILFRLPARLDERATVRVTYTDPELAQIGLTEAEAVEKFGADKIQLASWPLAENDRARAERRTEGLVKLVADRRGRLLGASILAPSAGEMIAVIAAAMAGNLKLAQLAGLVLPYPSYSEAIKRAAGNAFAARLFSPRVRQLVRLLLRLPR